jgi:hypothetical protein
MMCITIPHLIFKQLLRPNVDEPILDSLSFKQLSMACIEICLMNYRTHVHYGGFYLSTPKNIEVCLVQAKQPYGSLQNFL